jgi:hypothetical protein
VDLPNECKGDRDHWKKQAVRGGVVRDPDYTVRAWMAVVSYMLADYAFLYE